jgi:hypothetical protein
MIGSRPGEETFLNGGNLIKVLAASLQDLFGNSRCSVRPLDLLEAEPIRNIGLILD